MEKEHRTVLQKNRTYLINSMSHVEGLIDRLMETNIFTPNMQQDVMAKRTLHDQNRAILDILPKRGPKAFHDFIRSLIDTDQEFIVEQIAPNVDVSKFRTASSGPTVLPPEGKGASSKPMPVAPRESKGPPIPVAVPVRPTQSGHDVIDKNVNAKPGSPTLPPVAEPVKPEETQGHGDTTAVQPSSTEIYLEKASENWPENLNYKMGSREFSMAFTTEQEANSYLSRSNVYKLEGKRLGVIINNRNFTNKRLEDRSSSDMDSFRIQQVLAALGFSTTGNLKTNISSKSFRKTLDSFLEKVGENVCVVVLVVLSYGGKGTIMCADDEMISLQEIVDKLSKCAALQGKPKVVLMQACGAKLKDVESRDLCERDGLEADAEQIRHSLSQLQLASPLCKTRDSRTPTNMPDTKGKPDTTAAPTPPLDVGTNADILVAMSVMPDESLSDYRSLFILSLSYILCQFAKTCDFTELLHMGFTGRDILRQIHIKILKGCKEIAILRPKRLTNSEGRILGWMLTI